MLISLYICNKTQLPFSLHVVIFITLIADFMVCQPGRMQLLLNSDCLRK